MEFVIREMKMGLVDQIWHVGKNMYDTIGYNDIESLLYTFHIPNSYELNMEHLDYDLLYL